MKQLSNSWIVALFISKVNVFPSQYLTNLIVIDNVIATSRFKGANWEGALNSDVSVFEAELEREIVSETSGDFKRLALSLLQGNRDESEVVDKEVAKEDALVRVVSHFSIELR